MYAGLRLNQNRTDPIPQIHPYANMALGVLCNQSMFSFPVSLSPTVTQQFSMQITLAQVDRDAAIVTSSWDTTVRLWDAGTGEPVGIPLRGHTNPVNSISFSPDGTRIVAGFSLKGDE
jgi:WD40 repeat protein